MFFVESSIVISWYADTTIISFPCRCRVMQVESLDVWDSTNETFMSLEASMIALGHSLSVPFPSISKNLI